MLEFMFNDVLTEIDALARVAEPFIAAESRQVLRNLATNLELLREKDPPTVCNWGISDSHPLKTEEASTRDAQHVTAEITSTWDIRCIGRGTRRRGHADRFALAGIASTRVRLRSTASGAELGMWRMEVADAASPGCYFHVQIMGEGDQGPFPRSLSVPRLPAIHTTPLAAVEYVLGELFGDGWDQTVAQGGVQVQRWAPIHRRWLSRLLKWQLAEVEGAGGSPWLAIKRSKPSATLFT